MRMELVIILHFLNGLMLVPNDGRGIVTIVVCWRTFFFALNLKGGKLFF